MQTIYSSDYGQTFATMAVPQYDFSIKNQCLATEKSLLDDLWPYEMFSPMEFLF